MPESAKRNPEVKTKLEGKGKAKEDPEAGHTDEVLNLAVSHDGKVLASAGKDKIVGVWDVAGEGGKWMRGLAGHKDRVAVSPAVSVDVCRHAHPVPSFTGYRFPHRHLTAIYIIFRPHHQAVRPVDTVIYRDLIWSPRLYSRPVSATR